MKFPFTIDLAHSTWGRQILAWILALTGLTLTVSANITIEVTETPEEYRNGWAGPDYVAAAAPVVAEMPPFKIVGSVGDNAGKNIRLWNAAVKVLGKFPPNYPQQVGDCVSFGAKNAVQYTLLAQLAANHADDRIDVFGFDGHPPHAPPIEYREVHPSFIYGVSRVQVGQRRLGRGDGSMGAWAAKAVNEYGIIALSEGPKYSGSLARDWGYNGPPADMLALGKQRLVRTVSPVKTPEDVRDAICNGYAVTIASMFGSASFETKDGRKVARGDASWAHQMCIIGYDGTASQPYWYVLNSWGETAHPAPLQGEPPGGFWITKSQLQRIVSAGDSFAFSSFDGFPAHDLNVNVFGAAAPAVASDLPPTIEVPYLGARAMPCKYAGLGLTGLGALLICGVRFGRSAVAAVAIVLALICAAPAQAEPVNPFSGSALDMPETVRVFAVAEDHAETVAVFAVGPPACDCERTGICTCGPSCECAGKRNRVAYLYTLPGCAPCAIAEQQVRAAALNGTLPADLRVVVDKSPPEWVTAVPTWHYQTPQQQWMSFQGDAAWFLHFNSPMAQLAVQQQPAAMQSVPWWAMARMSSGGCVNGRCGR